MKTTGIAQEITSLPLEAQKQVIDFVAFLKTRYITWQMVKHEQIRLVDEPFIGMWCERDDMQDSTAWVRNLRHCEWERNL